ncbi:MAG TPA: hypothetical protein PLE45_02825 [Spirochaetota bacterium]|nr:hypothetical protein [Spirochaetota bacterium]HOL57355.1 hypothetical protein [Spirochaetota bacterium]HPP04945.1 hypothetical protein [Spirochaetota bacterium]
MNKLGIDDYISSTISINIKDYENSVQIFFCGEIDMQDPEEIFMPFFENIHNKIIEVGLKEVNLNFENLNFLNSSGIKVLIKWIQKGLFLPEKEKYKFKIYASSKIPWQINSLKLLSMLSPTLIEIKVI